MYEVCGKKSIFLKPVQSLIEQCTQTRCRIFYDEEVGVGFWEFFENQG